jgi:hypothetical protein
MLERVCEALSCKGGWRKERSMSNRIVHIAKQLLNINDDIQFRFDFSKDNRRITIDDFELHIFEQTWSSTALGFGGVGGDAITNEYTYVFVPIYCNQNCFVYFGSQYAYQAEYNSVFKEDLTNCRMKPCNEAGKYTKKYKE